MKRTRVILYNLLVPKKDLIRRDLGDPQGRDSVVFDEAVESISSMNALIGWTRGCLVYYTRCNIIYRCLTVSNDERRSYPSWYLPVYLPVLAVRK